MKKRCLFLLAAALLICLASVALADVRPGEETTVTLSLNNINAAFVRVTADFDTSVFELVGYSTQNGTAGSKGIGLYDTNVLPSGDIGTVTLKVKENAAPGTYAVSGVLAECYDINENDGQASVTGGTVKVVGKTILVDSVVLDQKTVTLKTVDNITLKASVSPDSATDKSLKWTSSDTAVATVDSDGKVTAVSVGTAKITVSATDGSGKEDVCEIEVIPDNILVTAVTLNQTKATLNVGQKLTLKATVSPDNATNKAVKWKSSNKAVATVSSSGKVTAVGEGTAKITATAKDGSGKKATCTITVIKYVTAIELDRTEAALKVGESVILIETVFPDDATNQTLKWTSNDTAVATVDSDGIVTAIGVGTATITAAATDGSGKKATCTVKVNICGLSSIKLNKSEVLLDIGKTTTLKATVKPDDATDKSLKWTSSDKSVAKVNSSGKVTAVGVGTATITATARDGSGKKATCTVTVKKLVTSVKLNKSEVLLDIGKTTTLKATVKPDDATDKSLKWTSNDKNVAKVNSSGKVTAVSEGTATITATARDGSGKKASCTVTVKRLVTSVTFNKSEVLLNIGKTFTLKATVKPDDATDKSLKWTSSDKNVATVSSSGKVTAKGVGTATITATAQDGSGKKATCTVTVKKLVTSIVLNKASASLKVNGTVTLKAAVSPDNATDKTVKWTSSNTAVAKVSSSGKVTAVGKGTATITATAKDGSGKKATCTITVK